MRSASSFDWDDAAIARLSELWLDGITSGEIGRLMGISRSAAMGKLRRLNLLKRDDRPLIPRIKTLEERMAIARNLLKTSEQVSRPPQKPRIRKNKRPLAPPEPYQAPPPPPLPPIGSFDLLDLRNGHCRWPSSGDGPRWTFCGAKQTPNSSYCEAHHRISLSGQARGVPFYLAKLAAGQG